MPLRVRLNEGLGLATQVTALRAGIVSAGHDEWNEQFGDEVGKPYRSRLGQANFGNRNESSETSEQYAKRQKVDQKPLMPNGECSPEGNETGRQVNTGHEAVNIIEARRGFGLSEVELKRATEDGYSGH
jgi:hypothetical protein